MNRPIRKVAIAMAVLFLALFVNLNFVQVVKGSHYRDDPANRRVLLNEYSSQRGQIVVQGDPIAQSKASNDELKYQRKYSNGPVYAPATGYYSFTYGTTGIEDAENQILSGDAADLFTTKLGNILTGRNPRGGSVELTLNKAAQTAAYNAMRSGRGSFKRGAVVALDPQTGSILAMVSTPSFDPNKLASHDADAISKAYKAYINDKSEPMLNRALRQNYPAGSIFKIIDSAAAVKKGIKADDKIPAPNSYWPLEPKRTSSCPAGLSAPCVQNFEGERCQNGKTATLAFALAKSCNTAFAALAVEKLGPQALQDQARLFGFDGPDLSVPLPVAGSTIGTASVLSDNAALAQTSFGQRDVRVTPLQAAMLSAAVANNGTLMRPFLVKSERRPNLTVLKTTDPKQLSQVIDPDLDQELIKMMEGVVTNPAGTGGPANVTAFGDSVKIAGKTGTADVGQTSASNDKPDAWFTGFALVKGSPKIAVAVVMENAGVAGNEATGGLAAGPVAKKVIEAYLDSINIPKG
ncbi:MAG: peptidoglycan D,D-transpeptidase FtsI family protein [Jatrophihabitans sp.]|uniref:peptidoglycan D,D-transpeptidase FtsI family protein n=1 Tax=Jatrophihabitans sp. TaxID=1932789 RepID=UPI00390F0B96